MATRNNISSKARGSTVIDGMLSKAVQKELGELHSAIGDIAAAVDSAGELFHTIEFLDVDPQACRLAYCGEFVMNNLDTRLDELRHRLGQLGKPAGVQS